MDLLKAMGNVYRSRPFIYSEGSGRSVADVLLSERTRGKQVRSEAIIGWAAIISRR